MFNHKKNAKKIQKPNITGKEHVKNHFINKIKNVPMFLVVGLILMIVIIMSIYYIFIYYAPEIVIQYSGYAIQGKQMVQNLKSNNTDEVDRYIDLVEVKEQELVYKKLNSYYVGEKNKTEIDVNYPIYVNELNTILNLSKDTKLITVNYQEVEGYPEFLLTGGVMYNGDNLTRADGNEYLFLKTDDDIYTNVTTIKIETKYNTYVIEENSNIYFTEESINYYELKGTYLQYYSVEDIDDTSKVIINGKELTYKELLEKLGKVESEKNQIQEEDKETEENKIEENESENKDEDNTGKEETTNNSPVKWIKPEVSCSEFEEQVYSAKTDLKIVDQAGVITKGIVFEFRKDGKLDRRFQILSSGIVDLSGLSPDTEYKITGLFYYKDEEGIELEEQFYSGTIHTKGLELLGNIKLRFENGEIYSKKVEIKNIKIENDLTDEVLKGISKMVIEIDGMKYNLLSEDIRGLRQGKEVTYQTSESVKSNKKIKYEIKAYDKHGNELKIENGFGETRTSKEEPKVNIILTKQNVLDVEFRLQLTNKDNLKLENYRYVVINQGQEIVKEGRLKESDKTLNFNDLNSNDYYIIEIYADYDLEDGKGIKRNQIIGEGTFVTRTNCFFRIFTD